MGKMVELSNQLADVVSQIVTESDKLGGELSKVDRELSDLQHFIEFTKFDVFRGYKAIKELKDVLDRRRDIKDDMKIAMNLKSNIANMSALPQKCANELFRIENQAYSPREKTDLFLTGKNAEDEALISAEKLGVLPAYFTMTFQAKNRKQHLQFDGFMEAFNFVLCKENLVNAEDVVKKNVAKKIIGAALNHKKYGELEWSLPELCVEKNV